jgi:hypothetical protein
MQPSNTNRTNQDSTRPRATDPFDDQPSPVVREPMISADPVTMANTGNLPPSGASRAGQPQRAARSIGSWVVPLVLLAGLALVFFIAMRRPPAADNNLPTPGDQVTPNSVSNPERR